MATPSTVTTIRSPPAGPPDDRRHLVAQLPDPDLVHDRGPYLNAAGEV